MPSLLGGGWEANAHVEVCAEGPGGQREGRPRVLDPWNQSSWLGYSRASGLMGPWAFYMEAPGLGLEPMGPLYEGHIMPIIPIVALLSLL